MAKNIRQGVEDQERISVDERLYKNRSTFRLFIVTFFDPFTFALVLAVLTFWLAVAAPHLLELVFLPLLFGAPFLIPRMASKNELPYTYPEAVYDTGNNKKNSKLKYTGNMFFGYNRSPAGNGEQVWMDFDQIKTHMLVFGSTGSGKTETLLSIVSNALMWGSGFAYVDGKGDMTLWYKIYTLARIFGREHDCILINYFNNESGAVTFDRFETNTFNPVASSGDNELISLIAGLLGEAEGSNRVFTDRANQFIAALVPLIILKRDFEKEQVSFKTINHYMILKNIVMLACEVSDKTKKRKAGYHESLELRIWSFLGSLPNIDKDKLMGTYYKILDPENEKVTTFSFREETSTQFSYVTMQISKALDTFSAQYRYIFEHEESDLNPKDMLVNRRIMIALIPALATTAAEMEVLGKVLVSGIKGMLAKLLGDRPSGSKVEIVERKLSNSPSPILFIFDEVGYYMVEGMDALAAQARSMGVCLIFAAQDKAAMQKSNETVAVSVIANTNVKMIMKLEDPDVTWDLVKKIFGEVTIETKSKSDFSEDKQDFNYVKEDRVTFGALKDQGPGQSHFIFGDKLTRMQGFYADPDQYDVSEARMMEMVPVKPYKKEHIFKGHTEAVKVIKFFNNLEVSEKDIREKSALERMPYLSRLAKSPRPLDNVNSSIKLLFLFYFSVHKEKLEAVFAKNTEPYLAPDEFYDENEERMTAVEYKKLQEKTVTIEDSDDEGTNEVSEDDGSDTNDHGEDIIDDGFESPLDDFVSEEGIVDEDEFEDDVAEPEAQKDDVVYQRKSSSVTMEIRHDIDDDDDDDLDFAAQQFDVAKDHIKEKEHHQNKRQEAKAAKLISQQEKNTILYDKKRSAEYIRSCNRSVEYLSRQLEKLNK